MKLATAIFMAPDARLRSGWRFLLALVAVVAASIIANIVAAGVSGNVVIFNAISRPLSALLMFLLFLLLARFLDQAKDPSAYLGLGLSPGWFKEFAAGIFCGALLVSACLGVIGLVGSYHLTWAPPSQIGRFNALLVVAFILLGGAITEELMFRSYPFLRLIELLSKTIVVLPWESVRRHATGIGSAIAILILAALFGSVHLGNPNVTFWGFADTVLIGIFFGVLMVRTGSLWLLWGIHFAWNFTLGALFGLPVSGITQFSVWTSGTATGPRWLTGGAYGIEASATAALLIVIGVIVLLCLKKGVASELITGIQSE